MTIRPKKLGSRFAAGRARQHILSRFNPIRGLTPARLSSYLDAFDQGYLRNAAEAWAKIAERDEQVVACSTKRVRAPSRLRWEILPINDSAEAARHKQILEDFYNNITVTHVLDEDERGGVRLLIQQMLSSVGMRYAVHEIVWRPRAGGLQAEFRHVPLQFFEHHTGRLRFLESDLTLEGIDLAPGGWMVTTGAGLMQATSIAYMFKAMPLKAWVTFTEKFGIPGLHATTSAPKDSPDWCALVDAVAGFGEDLALVTNDGTKITPIEVNGANAIPHEGLVDRMDRAISRIWLGGDLATMSQKQGAVGARPQVEDLSKLEADDAHLVSETLQQYVDRWVIKYRTGLDRPLAYFSLMPRPTGATDIELKVDEFLLGAGVPIGRKDLLERYGRAEPDPGEELALAPAVSGSTLSNSRAKFFARPAKEMPPSP
jgi:phage gp29-like protein